MRTNTEQKTAKCTQFQTDMSHQIEGAVFGDTHRYANT